MAARLRAAAGIVATAEAAQCTADERWWQLAIVGTLCDRVAVEVDAGRLGEAAAVASVRRAAAIEVPEGASTALRRHKGTASIVAALLLYALGLAGGAGAPLPYSAIKDATAVCGGSNSQVSHHSQSDGKLRWVWDQLGVVPPGKAAGVKVGGPAAAKKAKQNRQQSQASGSKPAKPAKPAKK